MKNVARLLCITSLLLAAGCGSVEPWVKPYERQNFADPIMALDRDPVSSAYINHARPSCRPLFMQAMD